MDPVYAMPHICFDLNTTCIRNLYEAAWTTAGQEREGEETKSLLDTMLIEERRTR